MKGFLFTSRQHGPSLQVESNKVSELDGDFLGASSPNKTEFLSMIAERCFDLKKVALIFIIAKKSWRLDSKISLLRSEECRPLFLI